MLGVRNYTQGYVDVCRLKVESDIVAYKQRIAVTSAPTIDGFEAIFFNNMVLVLDRLFVHRLRTVEGKDGNPLNEVRVICDAVMLNNTVMHDDTSIKLTPAKSVLKYQVGDEIKLSEADFRYLSTAFFAEIEKKFL